MSTSDNCKDGASKSSDEGVCEVNDMLQNMNTSDKEDDNVSACANCGKKGDDVKNTCNKCKMVIYCNAACKKKHRHKHNRKNVRDLWLSCMIKNYSNNLHRQKIVRYALYVCQH